MIAIIEKELKYYYRYPLSALNLLLSPFFMLAPYVYVAHSMNLEIPVLKNILAWFWLNQFLFGVGGSINEERMLGTLVNVICVPIKLTRYLLAKTLAFTFICSINTLSTIFIFFIMGFTMHDWIFFLCTLIMRVGNLYAFSLFFCSIALRYKRVNSLNSIIQQTLGVLSGYTANISNYPLIVRFVSYCIPLTYTVLSYKINEFFTFNYFSYFFFESLLSIVYYMIGTKLLLSSIKIMKQNGEIEQW